MDKTALQVLSRAADAIAKGREAHGDAHPSFSLMAAFWNAYINHTNKDILVELKPHDVAVMMCLFKIARAAYAYDFDNYVDEAGYTALAAMLHPKTTHAGKSNDTV